MIECIALLVLIVLVIYVGKQYETREAFQGAEEIPYLSACPSGMTSFYLPNGRPACCDGALTDGRCRFHMQCAMTGAGTSDLPNCTDILRQDYRRKSNRQCPPSMTTYFEDASQKRKGCTSGGLDADSIRPALPGQPTCYIYPTLEENQEKADSCFIQKAMEEAPCFGTQCIKSITPSTPPLVTVQFQDDKGMMRTAYTRASARYFLDKTMPGWREKGIDLDKSLQVAEVAKAYYVDKTLQIKDIQL